MIALIILMGIPYAGCSEKDPNVVVSDSINDDMASEFSLPTESFEDPDTLPDASSQTATETQGELSSLDNTKQGWGMGSRHFDEMNRPLSSLDFNEKYGKYDADFIKEDANKIYLTFDEGYESGYTDIILDTLKEKDVSAVFFVTYNYVLNNSELIQRMVDEGHVLGNHLSTHPSMPDLNEQECTEEIVRLDTLVQEDFNYKMYLIRPPMGQFSEKTLAIAQNLDYRTVFWSFAYKDWDTNSQPLESTALTKMNERLHNGAIYLLHAVSKTNANVLGDFIDQARDADYEFAKYEK